MRPSSSTEASPTAYTNRKEAQGGTRQWDRGVAAGLLHQFQGLRKDGRSERDAAERVGAPRSTLLHWAGAGRPEGVDPELADFLASPTGLVLVHRILVAAVFVLTLRGPDGIRMVSEFLALSGLDAFVASSFGTLQKLVVRVEEAVVAFGDAQREQLAADMTSKTITVCQDETFHPKICLVAIDAVSNYILLEEYADKRDTETWSGSLNKALEGLPVEVKQTTSDEAKALLAHAKELGAHHSPDVFHVQQDLSRATSLSLRTGLKLATENLEATMRSTEQVNIDTCAYNKSSPHAPGRPPDFLQRSKNAIQAEIHAQKLLEQATEYRDKAQGAMREVSRHYHPYSLSTGAAQSAEDVEKTLTETFAKIRGVAVAAELPGKAHGQIAKAERLIPSMVDTIRFVHEQTIERVDSLNLEKKLRAEVMDSLLPAMYLGRAANRAPNAEQRHELEARAAQLRAALCQTDTAFSSLTKDRRAVIETEALACADLFQRSSSCVEGRNGRLSLFHHGLHALSTRKLAALTVVHNYYVIRSDGTTAAQRFFGSAHDDLFEHLLRKIPHPPRPAKRRPRKPRQPQHHPSEGALAGAARIKR